MAPVYGLAECAVALPPPGREPFIDRVKRDALSRRGVAEPAMADDANAIEIAACGYCCCATPFGKPCSVVVVNRTCANW